MFRQEYLLEALELTYGREEALAVGGGFFSPTPLTCRNSSRVVGRRVAMSSSVASLNTVYAVYLPCEICRCARS